MTDVLTPRQMPLGRVRPPVGGNLATMAAGTAVAAAEPLANYARSFMDRRGAEADARREANLQAFRDQQQERMTMEQDLGEAAPRMPTPRPAAPRRPAAPPPRPRIREMTADELNEMELRRARAERQMEEDDARERRRREEEAARQMGGSGNIGSASARERGELEGHPGDFTYNNYKKGGMVKPKKMMKGGIVAKPKVAAKSKPKPKPMPFKKGGMIKKGKK
jgi:type IV secretory pathway VirB10-like protein